MPRALISLLGQVRNVNVNPRANGLPGSSVLQDLIDGLAFWGLLACLAGDGHRRGGLGVRLAHATTTTTAPTAGAGCSFRPSAALAIGASAAIVNFFAEAGGKVE